MIPLNNIYSQFLEGKTALVFIGSERNLTRLSIDIQEEARSLAIYCQQCLDEIMQWFSEEELRIITLLAKNSPRNVIMDECLLSEYQYKMKIDIIKKVFEKNQLVVESFIKSTKKLKHVFN